MTSQKDQIQSLIADIDGLLNKSSPRLPWVMSGDAAQQRQVLERLRNFLVSLQRRVAIDDTLNQPKVRRDLMAHDIYYQQSSSPSTEPQPDLGQPDAAQQMLQAVVQEMSYLRASLVQPLQDDVDALRQQRETLTQEVRHLEAQRQSYALMQQQANQQQLTAELLQAMMGRLQDGIAQQVAQALATTQVQPMPYPTEALTGSNPAALTTGTTPPLLHPAQRLEQIQLLQAQSDQMLISLDSTLRAVFDVLQRNVQGYQESLSQGVDRMHNLGQQGEIMFNALVNRLAQQLGREASSLLQSSQVTEREPTQTGNAPLDSTVLKPSSTIGSAAGAIPPPLSRPDATPSVANLNLPFPGTELPLPPLPDLTPVETSLSPQSAAMTGSSSDLDLNLDDLDIDDLNLGDLDLSQVDTQAIDDLLTSETFETEAFSVESEGLLDPLSAASEDPAVLSAQLPDPTTPGLPEGDTAELDAALKFLEQLSTELQDQPDASTEIAEARIDQVLGRVPDEADALIVPESPTATPDDDELEELYESLFGTPETSSDPFELPELATNELATDELATDDSLAPPAAPSEPVVLEVADTLQPDHVDAPVFQIPAEAAGVDSSNQDLERSIAAAASQNPHDAVTLIPSSLIVAAPALYTELDPDEVESASAAIDLPASPVETTTESEIESEFDAISQFSFEDVEASEDGESPVDSQDLEPFTLSGFESSETLPVLDALIIPTPDQYLEPAEDTLRQSLTETPIAAEPSLLSPAEAIAESAPSPTEHQLDRLDIQPDSPSTSSELPEDALPEDASADTAIDLDEATFEASLGALDVSASPSTSLLNELDNLTAASEDVTADLTPPEPPVPEPAGVDDAEVDEISSLVDLFDEPAPAETGLLLDEAIAAESRPVPNVDLQAPSTPPSPTPESAGQPRSPITPPNLAASSGLVEESYVPAAPEENLLPVEPIEESETNLWLDENTLNRLSHDLSTLEGLEGLDFLAEEPSTPVASEPADAAADELSELTLADWADASPATADSAEPPAIEESAASAEVPPVQASDDLLSAFSLEDFTPEAPASSPDFIDELEFENLLEPPPEAVEPTDTALDDLFGDLPDAQTSADASQVSPELTSLPENAVSEPEEIAAETPADPSEPIESGREANQVQNVDFRQFPLEPETPTLTFAQSASAPAISGSGAELTLEAMNDLFADLLAEEAESPPSAPSAPPAEQSSGFTIDSGANLFESFSDTEPPFPPPPEAFAPQEITLEGMDNLFADVAPAETSTPTPQPPAQLDGTSTQNVTLDNAFGGLEETSAPADADSAADLDAFMRDLSDPDEEKKKS